MKRKTLRRCPWASLSNPLYLKYHDEDWGVPVRDDRLLFEMLILEGAQAGLSWETILNKRRAYQKAFANFDAKKVAKFDKKKVRQLLGNAGIVRNRLKIESAIRNAKIFLEMQKEFGSFAEYLWRHVDHTPVVNRPRAMKNIPARSDLSDEISRDLKKRGMNFVGSTIIYAYLQAVGVVNDHLTTCFRHRPLRARRKML